MDAYRWMETRARWNQLRALGSSNLVRASVLMPAFGYMLLLNENVHQYLIIKYDGKLLEFLPSIWRIWLLFYGSFALAAATILYSIYCPSSIKNYETPFEMATAEGELQVNIHHSSRIFLTVESKYDGMTAQECELVELEPYNFSYVPVTRENWISHVSSALVHIWTIDNITRPGLRVILFSLFGIGLTLIAIPAVLTFLQVTLLALRTIFV